VQCEVFTAEKEAALKIQSVARSKIARDKFSREVQSAAFNALDNNDENVRAREGVGDAARASRRHRHRRHRHRRHRHRHRRHRHRRHRHSPPIPASSACASQLHFKRRNALIAAGLTASATATATSAERQKITKELEAIEVEAEYDGPRLEFPLTLPQVTAMMTAFKAGKMLHYKYAMQLLFAFRDFEATLPTLVATTVGEGEKLTVCGDTHGQLQDLFSIFTINGTPDARNRYLFNGDFVDRGERGCEVVFTLFAWHLLAPGACLLNRGNHEERSQNETAGFMSEVLDKYNGAATGDPGRGPLVYDTFEAAFDMLPLATLIEKGPRKVFVVHGGLFATYGIRLEQVAAVNVRGLRARPRTRALPRSRRALSPLPSSCSASARFRGAARRWRTASSRT
jgi:hypothetical protein